jgi:hypothetical protein
MEEQKVAAGMKLAKSSLELPLPFGNSATLFTVMTVLHN